MGYVPEKVRDYYSMLSVILNELIIATNSSDGFDWKFTIDK